MEPQRIAGFFVKEKRKLRLSMRTTGGGPGGTATPQFDKPGEGCMGAIVDRLGYERYDR